MRIKPLCKFTAFVFSIGISSHVLADNYFASIQYSVPSSGLTNTVYQAADSKRLCEALNDQYLKGLRTGCPQCKIEWKTCFKKLPDADKYIFDDKPGVFPYVSAPSTRVVVFGVPIEQAAAICIQHARNWTRATNQHAKCISAAQ